jgi:hypothetical protein
VNAKLAQVLLYHIQHKELIIFPSSPITMKMSTIEGERLFNFIITQKVGQLDTNNCSIYYNNILKNNPRTT